jgi:hypothetical protein
LLYNRRRKCTKKYNISVEATLEVIGGKWKCVILCHYNFNGWVEQRGYPGDERIMKYIISYLEGGEESFKHKIATYSTVLAST